jgi:hypothetical protein
MIWRFLAIFIILAFFNLLPMVAALPDEASFPDIPFKVFNRFVQNNFSSKISLSTVLLILFTMTNNTSLLNLHARQQNPIQPGEKRTKATGWIKALEKALNTHLGDTNTDLLIKAEQNTTMTEEQSTTCVALKLDAFAKVLKLYPYNNRHEFQGKLKVISHAEIRPVLAICPESTECEDLACQPRSLLQHTRMRDIPKVTLIKGSEIYKQVYMLTGICPVCNTTYTADHERVYEGNNYHSHIYLNSAKYLKVGQSIWVDRAFSNAVLNGMYSFHASATAYAEYWNNSFGLFDASNSLKVNRRQIWQAFVQESTRTIASSLNTHLVLKDGLAINEVTKEAFHMIGEKGLIRAADQHSCPECTQRYKPTSDIILAADPAALLGVDENQAVTPEPQIATDPTAQTIAGRSQIQSSPFESGIAELMDSDYPNVRMVILDGIVMGPQHCAFEDCTDELGNARGGVFCRRHETEYGAKCRIHSCPNLKIEGMQACHQHRREWLKHRLHRTSHAMAGVRRILQRPGEEMPWQQTIQHNVQPHDELIDEGQQLTHYFSPRRFYCVETICAPCGVVIAWTKFAKAESPTNILEFLESVYPTEESRPDYICIDKACLVLRTAIMNGSWDLVWKNTSRFIVDTYHYINHRTTDYLCRKWCNPAPLNGSAPNLVVTAVDKNGEIYQKRAFNTQVNILFDANTQITDLVLLGL